MSLEATDNRKGPAAWSRARVQYLQDAPPQGGYPEVRFSRNLPSRGLPTSAMLAITAGMITVGFALVIRGNRYRRELKEEKLAARRALIPILQAEEDARFIKARAANIEFETRVMKDVEGWVAGESVYFSRRN